MAQRVAAAALWKCRRPGRRQRVRPHGGRERQKEEQADPRGHSRSSHPREIKSGPRISLISVAG